jgi:hypothetical protein
MERLRWLGHSTVPIELDGVNLLTHPLFQSDGLRAPSGAFDLELVMDSMRAGPMRAPSSWKSFSVVGRDSGTTHRPDSPPEGIPRMSGWPRTRQVVLPFSDRAVRRRRLSPHATSGQMPPTWCTGPGDGRSAAQIRAPGPSRRPAPTAFLLRSWRESTRYASNSLLLGSSLTAPSSASFSWRAPG